MPKTKSQSKIKPLLAATTKAQRIAAVNQAVAEAAANNPRPRKPTTQVFTCRFLPDTVTALKAAGGAKLVRKLVERELTRLAKAAAK